mgnify:CR=1 FL=1
MQVHDGTAEQALTGRFFAVPAGAPRDRRPTDVTMLVTAAGVLALFATRAGEPLRGFEASIDAVFASFPGFMGPIWAILHDLLIAWAFGVALVAVVRRQWGLVRDLAIAVVAVVCIALVVSRVANGSWPDVLDDLFQSESPVSYPAVGLALWVAITSVASSHLSRPYRYLSRWLMTLGGLAALGLGVTSPTGSIGAVALGLAVAAAVHLALGSPGGMPSLTQVQAALAGIGIVAQPYEMVRRAGVVRIRARGESGDDLDVKLYGRDAWDGQLIVSLWRFIWYRDAGPTLALTRLQQVEHEAFLTLLAERRGAAVHSVVAAGADGIGDALLVIRRTGQPLDEVTAPLDDSLCERMWHVLATLHAARITHGAIDSERLFVDGGTVSLADFSAGEIESSPSAFLTDRAQLLATTAIRFGTQRAVEGAVAALGADGLADVSAYTQPAAMSPRLRRDLSAAGLDIDDIRAAAVAASGAQPRDLQRLRRLTLGRVLMAVLLFVAGSTLITGLLEIGLDTIFDALQEASLPIVLLAFAISLLSRPANAYALVALSPVKVPLGRLIMLQFAMNFVNLAMPSTAGRVAVNIRFFQRNGVEPTTAVAVGALDGFIGFLGQIVLGGSILLFGIGSVDLQLDRTFSMDAVGSLLVLLAVVLVVGIAVIALVPALRRRVVEAYVALRNFLGPLLCSPRRMAKAFCSNLAAEMVGALTLFTVLASFRQSVDLPDVILVSIGVGLFAGLMPVPGGIGVAEAALTAGFIALGVSPAIAFAAALTCRIVTFYFPPLIGWFALRWLQKHRYL